jgi:hypothetical protein
LKLEYQTKQTKPNQTKPNQTRCAYLQIVDDAKIETRKVVEITKRTLHAAFAKQTAQQMAEQAQQEADASVANEASKNHEKSQGTADTNGELQNGAFLDPPMDMLQACSKGLASCAIINHPPAPLTAHPFCACEARVQVIEIVLFLFLLFCFALFFGFSIFPLYIASKITLGSIPLAASRNGENPIP